MDMQTEQQQDSVQTDALPPKITKADFEQNETTKKAKILYWTRTITYLVLSSLLVAIAAYSFITPNHFTIGGIAGIAILINQVFPNVELSTLTILLNAPLIVLAFFFIKRKFALLTIANTLLQTLWLKIFENVFGDILKFKFGTGGEIVFAAIAAGLCVGAALAFAFKIGGSTGGADILAVLLKNKLKTNSIAWMIFAISAVVIVVSPFVYQENSNVNPDLAQNVAFVLPVMLSLFELFVESKTNESLLNGFNSAIEFRIITDKPEEMAHTLMKELNRGVTSIPATGMYTKITHSMLLCVVGRRQVTRLREIMKKVDPDSFAVMSTVSQVLGLGFYNSEIS